MRAFFTACNSSAGECERVYACVCMSVRIKLNTTCNFIYSKLNGGKHTQGGGGRVVETEGNVEMHFHFHLSVKLFSVFFVFN